MQELLSDQSCNIDNRRGKAAFLQPRGSPTITSTPNRSEIMVQEYTAYYSSAYYSNFLPGDDGAALADGQPSLQRCSRNDLISFLSLVTRLKVDTFQLSWEEGTPALGHGGTALVNQAAIREEQGMAFKRVGLNEGDAKIKSVGGTPESRLYKVLISEVYLLTHPSVRNHPNIVDLEAICWEVDFAYQAPRILPVLIFQKAPYGDLESFIMLQGPLETELVMEVFCVILRVVEHLHGCRMSYMVTYCCI